MGSPRDTFARKRADGSTALGAQAGLGSLLPRGRDHRGAPDSQPRRSGDRRAAAHQFESEFETMLDGAVFMAPAGFEQPLNYLRSGILARHRHAMLKGGATWSQFTSSKACEPLSSTCGCSKCWRPAAWASTGPGSKWATGTRSRTGWLNTVNSKVFATSTVTGAGLLRCLRGDGSSGATG